MKRMIALCLVFAFLLPTVCVASGAEDEPVFYRIQISAGEGIQAEKAIVRDGEIYIPAESFDKYTRYEYGKDKHSFVIKGQDAKRAFKALYVDVDNKRVNVSGKKVVGLSDCFEYGGSLYLPFCQMLPLLDADIFGVSNGVIQVSNPVITMADVLYHFNIEDVYFDYSKEFLDSPLLASLYVVPAYIFDTVVNSKYGRLDVVSHSGDFKEYKEIFSELLADNNLYLQAKAYRPSGLQDIIDSYKVVGSDQESLKTLFDWIEIAGKNADKAQGDALFELLASAYGLDDYKHNFLREINETWHEGKFGFAECVSAAAYLCTYVTIIDDNRNMLKAVYNTDGKVGAAEYDRKAAKHVCDLYGDNVGKAVFDELAMKYAGEITEKLLNPIAIYTNTAQVAGVLFEEFLPYSYSDVARLPLYAEVISSAKAGFNQNEMFTDKGAEAKRLSLLLCLMASRKAFMIMRAGSDYSSYDYYDERIGVLESYIKLLYLLGDNTEFDSFEHFEEHYRENLKKIGGIEFKKYPASLPKNSIGNLTEIGYFEKSNGAKSNISARAATDGVNLFVVTQKGIDRYGWNGTVEMTIEGSFGEIICYDGRLFASGEGGIFMMDTDGGNKECLSELGSYSPMQMWRDELYFFGDFYGETNMLYSYNFSDGFAARVYKTGEQFLGFGDDELAVYGFMPTFFDVWRFDPDRPYMQNWSNSLVGTGRLMSGGYFLETDGEKYYTYSTQGYSMDNGIWLLDEHGNELEKLTEGVFNDGLYRDGVLCLLESSEEGFDSRLVYCDAESGEVIARSKEYYRSVEIGGVIGDYWFLVTSDGVKIVHFPGEKN